MFQSYLVDENIDTIELLDVSAEEMIELLRFVYPQFECTITKENVTILLVLGRFSSRPSRRNANALRVSAQRFELQFLVSACRTFLLLFLSKLRFVNDDLLEQEDGTRVLISSLLDTFFIWFKEFADTNDETMSETLLKLFSRTSTKVLAQGTLEEKLLGEVFRGRAKFLEHELRSI